MNEVVQTSPTIGSNVEEVVWKNIHFIMWDLGGQESLRAAWNTYYSNTEVILIHYFWNPEVRLAEVILVYDWLDCNAKIS